jgi:hypothetical protein
MLSRAIPDSLKANLYVVSDDLNQPGELVGAREFNDIGLLDLFWRRASCESYFYRAPELRHHRAAPMPTPAGDVFAFASTAWKVSDFSYLCRFALIALQILTNRFVHQDETRELQHDFKFTTGMKRDGIMPNVRPFSIEDPQYDGLWRVMQHGWHSDPRLRALLPDFEPRKFFGIQAHLRKSDRVLRYRSFDASSTSYTRARSMTGW